MTLEVQTPEIAPETPAPIVAVVEPQERSTDDATGDELVAERRELREAQAKADEATEIKEEITQDVVEDAPVDELEGDPTPEDGEEPTEEIQAEADGDEQVQPAIDAPEFWSSDAKQHFGTLDTVTQAFLAEQDKVARTAVSQKMNEVSDKVKAGITHEQQQYQAKQSQLDVAIEHAQLFYQGEYGGITDEVLTQAVESGSITGEQAYAVIQSKKDAEVRLQQLETAKQETDALAHSAFVQEESIKLKELVPDFTDATKAPKLEQEIRAFLKNLDMPDSQISQISAIETSVVYDAMRWRNAQAKQKATPKRVPKPASKTLKPSGAQSGASQNTVIAKLQAEFNKTGDTATLLKIRKMKRANAA